MSTAPAGLVLAAGASSRMGSPKALLDYGGETGLERVVRALSGGGCAPVVVVLGAGAEEIRPRVPEVARAVVHESWAAGRTGSLKAGIVAAAGAAAWVVLPVDHPLATAEDVAALVAAWRTARPPLARAVHGGRGGHPVLLDARLREELLALGDDEPLRTVVRRHAAAGADVPASPGVLVNVDTPEDHERAVRGIARDRR